MSERTIPVADLDDQTAADLIRSVSRERATITVLLPNGESVEVRPSDNLQPMPVLEGTIPTGWKDAADDE